MALTVKELRQHLRGLNGDLPIYTADHDHGTYETNGRACGVLVLNQQKDEDSSLRHLEKNFSIQGTYVVIRVG